MKSNFHGDTFYQPLVESFVAGLPSILCRLKALLTKKQYQVAKELCHQLAGSSATYGYPELSLLLKQLENILSADPIEVGELVRHAIRLEEMIDKVTAAIAHFPIAAVDQRDP